MNHNVTKNKLQQNGIGKRYHDKSVTSYDHSSSKELMDWITEESASHFLAGNGMTFEGLGQEGYDLTILTARALIILGMTKLRREDFIDLLDYDNIQAMWEYKYPLAITNFLPDSKWVNPEAYKRLENLLNYYMDNGIIFILHIPVDKDNPDYGDLMSPVFLDRLQKNQKKFVIN